MPKRPGQDTEILFTPSRLGTTFLEGGYLAIVIPDSILTNSGLQYVRDEIEDIFRIVAVGFPLPQNRVQRYRRGGEKFRHLP